MPSGVYIRTEYHRAINRGRIRGEETRIKLRLSHLGHRHLEESKRKIAEASKFRWQDPEYKNKVIRSISKSLKGRIITPEWRGKISESKSGQKYPFRKRSGPQTDEHRRHESLAQRKIIMEGRHNFYIDGRSKEKEQYDNFEWRTWRLKVFKRDNYICQNCGKLNCYLEPHHIIPKRVDRDRIYDIDNGITLCRKCHQMTFYKEDKFANKFFSLILNQASAYCTD